MLLTAVGFMISGKKSGGEMAGAVGLETAPERLLLPTRILAGSGGHC